MRDQEEDEENYANLQRRDCLHRNITRDLNAEMTASATLRGVASQGVDNVDDGPEGWNQTDQHREQSTTDRVAKCPKDQETDDKGVNSTTQSQPMYPIMSNNIQQPDYKPMVNAQVPMTGSQHVTSQSLDTAMYMLSGNVANLTVCTEHMSQFISLLNTSINKNFLVLGTRIPRSEYWSSPFFVHLQTQ